MVYPKILCLFFRNISQMYFAGGSAGWVLSHTPGGSPALSPQLCRGSLFVAAALNTEKSSRRVHTGGGNEERIERKGTGLLTVQLDLMFCLNLQKCKYLTAVLVLFLFPFRQSICLHSIEFPPSSLLCLHSTSQKLQLFGKGLKMITGVSGNSGCS